MTATVTATSGTDYVPVSGRVTFAPGVTSQQVVVPVIGDVVNEADETFALNLSNPVNTLIADSQGIATIVDNDPLPNLTVSDFAFAEGNSGTKLVTFNVNLSAASGRTISVAYATADGTATSGSDYVAKSGTLSFSPGMVTQSVTVTVNGDAVVEPNETFFLNLSNASNAVIVDSQGQALIVDDDAAPALSIADMKTTEGNSGTKSFSFVVSLSGASTQTVTVPFATADGTATAGSDYVSTSGTLIFTPGQTLKTVNVVVNRNTTGEGDETFFVNLKTPTNANLLDEQGLETIQNDDTSLQVNDVTMSEKNSGTVDATFTMTLSAPINAPVSVAYATANGTANATSDYVATGGTLIF